MGNEIVCFLHFVRLQKWNTKFMGQDRPNVIGFDFLLSMRRGNDPVAETSCFICNTEGWTNFVKQVITNMIHHHPNSIKVATRGMSAASYSRKHVLISFISTKLHFYQSFPTPGRSGCVMRPVDKFINYVPYETAHNSLGN